MLVWVGITWQAVEKLLAFMKDGGTTFHVELNSACKSVVRCVDVNLELMHQARVIGQLGPIDKANKKSKGMAKESQKAGRMTTFNIPYSARCNAGRSDEDKLQCLPTREDIMAFKA